MATETLEEQTSDEESSAGDQMPKLKLSLANKKVKILLLLILVMGVEAAGFYFLVPSAPGNESKDDPGGNKENVETVEIAIGDFNTTNGQATPGGTYSVVCKVTAVVAKSQEVAFELAVNKKHKASVGQAIQKVLNSASLPELNDSGHGVIRRKIREEINKVLRKSFVNEIILTDWRALPI